MKWKQLFLTLLVYLAVDIVNAAQSPIVLTGNYRCKGDNIFNSGKFDEPTTVTKTGDTYHFIWQNGPLTFHGNGILQNNQLAIIYWVPINPAQTGVVTYQILPNGDLSGRWTTRGGMKTGNEYCQKLK